MANILIVEDDISHLELLAEIIKFGGHTPWTATNSGKALKVINKHNIDLIITDISLTNESGLDFIARLQKLKIDAPFIVVSGSTHIADHEKAQKLNALSFLKKPVEPAELLKAINSI